MCKRQAAFVFGMFIVAGLVGCGGTEEGFEQDPSVTTVQQAEEFGERPPPNGLNGTSPSCFWAHGTQQALRTLGGAGLDQGRGTCRPSP